MTLLGTLNVPLSFTFTLPWIRISLLLSSIPLFLLLISSVSTELFAGVNLAYLMLKLAGSDMHDVIRWTEINFVFIFL